MKGENNNNNNNENNFRKRLQDILKQKSLATQNLVGILFIIKILVLKWIKNLLLKFVYMLTIRS